MHANTRTCLTNRISIAIFSHQNLSIWFSVYLHNNGLLTLYIIPGLTVEGRWWSTLPAEDIVKDDSVIILFWEDRVSCALFPTNCILWISIWIYTPTITLTHTWFYAIDLCPPNLIGVHYISHSTLISRRTVSLV